MNCYGGGEKILETVIDYLLEKGNDCYILNFTIGSEAFDCKEWVAPFKKYSDKVFVKILPMVRRNVSLVWSFRYYLFGKYDYGTEEIKAVIEEIGVFDLILVIPVFLVGGARKAVQESGSKAKVILWDHGSIPDMIRSLSYRDRFRKIIIKPVLWKWVSCADTVFAISSGLSNIIKQYLPEMNVRLIYNPVGERPTNFIQKSKKPIIFYVGRLDNYSKNITFLLDALAEIQDEAWTLVVFGEGPDRGFLEKKASRLGISDRVEWRGFVENPLDSVKEGTCLVLTSRAEGFPLVLVEAIERGLPAISADCPTGPSEIIIPGQNGFLYEPGNREQLVMLLKACIDGKMNLPPAEIIARTVDKYGKNEILEVIEKTLLEVVE